MGVERIAVVPELDGDVVTSERLDQPRELVARGGRSAVDQRTRHRALAAAGEDDPPSAAQLRELVHAMDRTSLLAAQLCERDRAAQPRVAERIAREDDEVIAFRIGDAVGDARGADGELRAEDRRQPDGARGLREPDDPVHPVVIGDRERVESEPRRFLGELLGMRRTVEPRVGGVAVQLGVRDARSDPDAEKSRGRWYGIRLRDHAGESPSAPTGTFRRDGRAWTPRRRRLLQRR